MQTYIRIGHVDSSNGHFAVNHDEDEIVVPLSVDTRPGSYDAMPGDEPPQRLVYAVMDQADIDRRLAYIERIRGIA
jgi:hypothetical protein